MSLTPEQLRELEDWGPATVRQHLAGFPFGAGANITGFKCTGGAMTRSDITDWLVIKSKAEQRQQVIILWSAVTAGVASVLAVVIGVITIAIQK